MPVLPGHVPLFSAKAHLADPPAFAAAKRLSLFVVVSFSLSPFEDHQKQMATAVLSIGRLFSAEAQAPGRARVRQRPPNLRSPLLTEERRSLCQLSCIGQNRSGTRPCAEYLPHRLRGLHSSQNHKFVSQSSGFDGPQPGSADRFTPASASRPWPRAGESQKHSVKI